MREMVADSVVDKHDSALPVFLNRLYRAQGREAA